MILDLFKRGLDRVADYDDKYLAREFSQERVNGGDTREQQQEAGSSKSSLIWHFARLTRIMCATLLNRVHTSCLNPDNSAPALYS